MNHRQILIVLNDIFIKIIDNNKINLTELSDNKEIIEWDSLHHIQIIDAIERHYNIRFTTTEIQSKKSVNNLINMIKEKLKE